MLIWFVALAPILVAEVFRSPMIDYRMVMLGAVLPLIEIFIGGPYVLHTLVGAVAALVIVMVATQGKRLRRRQLLGIPIGLFVHLILDGAWTQTELFWWPAFGLDFANSSIPELGRPLPVVLVLEAVGAVAGVWAWRRYGLGDPENRDRFRSSGQLDRKVLT